LLAAGGIQRCPPEERGGEGPTVLELVLVADSRSFASLRMTARRFAGRSIRRRIARWETLFRSLVDLVLGGRFVGLLVLCVLFALAEFAERRVHVFFRHERLIVRIRLEVLLLLVGQ
jgi:hypothetical protein